MRADIVHTHLEEAARVPAHLFHLKKWYFDLLTANHDFLFLYFASMHIAGVTAHSLTLHVARPDLGIVLTRYIPVPGYEEAFDGKGCRVISMPGGVIRITEEECALELSGNQCAVNLRYRGTGDIVSRPFLISNATHPHILWQPLQLKYCVSGFVVLDGKRIDVRDVEGYADYVECTYPPSLVPVRSFLWGRLHHPDIDLTFVHARGGRGGREWSALYGKSYDGSLESDCLSVVPSFPVNDLGPGRTGVERYDLHGMTTGGEILLKVRRVTVVHRGSFIDDQNISSAILRAAAKLLSRNPRSTKFLSVADVFLVTGTTQRYMNNIPMIDERVIL